MNTFWLKIAGLAVAVVVGIVVIGSLTGGDSQPKEPERTIYDQWEEDDERLMAEPEFNEPPAAVQPVEQPAQAAPAPQPDRPSLSSSSSVRRKRSRRKSSGYGSRTSERWEDCRSWATDRWSRHAGTSSSDGPRASTLSSLRERLVICPSATGRCTISPMKKSTSEI